MTQTNHVQTFTHGTTSCKDNVHRHINPGHMLLPANTRIHGPDLAHIQSDFKTLTPHLNQLWCTHIKSSGYQPIAEDNSQMWRIYDPDSDWEHRHYSRPAESCRVSTCNLQRGHLYEIQYLKQVSNDSSFYSYLRYLGDTDFLPRFLCGLFSWQLLCHCSHCCDFQCVTKERCRTCVKYLAFTFDQREDTPETHIKKKHIIGYIFFFF